MMDWLHEILGPDLGKAGFIILNLILIESLLSVDNAAVLATMVMHLPPEERGKALRIGLIFAYIFRGAALLLAGILIQINWLKLIGGGYLLFLAIKFFYTKWVEHKSRSQEAREEAKELLPKKRKAFFINQFWSTVVMVEAMDLVFSLDNVLAAVAYTKNIYLVCIGVFIGIITMRLVAGYFVRLMEKFPFLDLVAFIVIALLGGRLIAEYFMHNPAAHSEEGHGGIFDTIFSVGTIAIFVIPIFTSLLFNFPKQHTRKTRHKKSHH
jgi:YkoY family integral membrane protein